MIIVVNVVNPIAATHLLGPLNFRVAYEPNIRTLKRRIQDEIGIPPCPQHLLKQDTFLGDHLRLVDVAFDWLS